MGSKTLEGVLHFFSETGTEGGYWAFQDKNSITKEKPIFGIYRKVFDANNPEREGKPLEQEVLFDNEWLPLPDPMTKDPDYIISSLFCGEPRGDKEADTRLMKKYAFRIIYAAERMDKEYGAGNWEIEEDGDETIAITKDGERISYGGTPRTEPDRPYGVPENALIRTIIAWDDGTKEKRLSDSLLVSQRSYEGLNILEDGDELTIYHPKTKEEIWSGTIALENFPPFQEDVHGLWIHAEQKGIERETWAEYFFKEYPAELKKK